MKTKLLLLIFFGLGLLQVQAESDYQITDSLLMGYYVDKVVWDSQDTLWFTLYDNTYTLGKAYGDSVWLYNSTNSDLNATINDIAIDSKDTIWLATDKGLINFDHHQFYTYAYDSIHSESAYYYFSNIVVDLEDNIWLGGYGLAKFSKSSWSYYTSDNSQLSSTGVNSIAVDNKNNIWVGCCKYVTEAEIIKINKDNWTVYNEDSVGVSMYYFLSNSLETDTYNNLFALVDYSLIADPYVMGNPTVLKYDGEVWEVLDTVSNDYYYPKEIACDGNGIVWVVNRGDYELRYLNNNEWNVWGESYNNVHCLQIGIDGSLWMLTVNGIYVISDVNANKLEPVKSNNEVNIFPNPTGGSVTIDMDDFVYCEVYNMMGVLLERTQETTFDLSEYGGGTYLLNIVDTEENRTIIKMIVY